MEYSKKQVFEKLWEELKLLSNEELFVLYKSEFSKNYDNYKHVNFTNNEIYYSETGEKANNVEVMQFIVKFLNHNNQNYKLVVVYNSIQKKNKLSYQGEGVFKMEVLSGQI